MSSQGTPGSLAASTTRAVPLPLPTRDDNDAIATSFQHVPRCLQRKTASQQGTTRRVATQAPRVATRHHRQVGPRDKYSTHPSHPHTNLPIVTPLQRDLQHLQRDDPSSHHYETKPTIFNATPPPNKIHIIHIKSRRANQTRPKFQPRIYSIWLRVLRVEPSRKDGRQTSTH